MLLFCSLINQGDYYIRIVPKKLEKSFFFLYTEKENSVECIKRQVKKKNNVDDCHWGERA
jgi:hypothetical protein